IRGFVGGQERLDALAQRAVQPARLVEILRPRRRRESDGLVEDRLDLVHARIRRHIGHRRKKCEIHPSPSRGASYTPLAMPMGSGQPLTPRDILDDLDADAQANSAFFPDLDHGYNYQVDARLSAFGDGERWVIAIEQLAVNPRAWGVGGIHTTVYYHGNSI